MLPIDLQPTCQSSADYLLSRQNKSGFWPYVQNQEASLEATSWCAIALRNYPGIADETIQYLLSHQNRDGGWSTAAQSGTSDWNSSLCLLALHILKANSTLSSAKTYLIDHRFSGWINSIAYTLLFLIKGPSAFLSARGWPWTDGCFNWVEPTSYALLSLKPLMYKDPSLNSVIQSANDFLLQRQCKGGGWNHGDSKPLQHRP
jgi:prenyltransferase beta subunit